MDIKTMQIEFGKECKCELLKLQDTKEEKQQIEREKLRGVIHSENSR